MSARLFSPTALRRIPALGIVAVLTTAACAGSPDSDDSGDAAEGYPVTVENCGTEVTVSDQPTSVITMNQGATEVVLALGLEDQLAGTAYLDDAVPDKWQAAYDAVPVLAAEYPDKETVIDADPDFIYSSYSSAFDDDAAGPRDEWADSDVATYISPFGCAESSGDAEATFDAVWGEISDIATILGHPEAAEELRAEQQASLDELAGTAAGEGIDVFWFDSGTDAAFAGAGDGGPQLILDAVGATNVFADIEGSWADVSWEQVIDANPDVIVLADAGWSTAQEKIDQLKADPALNQLTAVKNDAFVTIPFSESTPGARLVDGAISVSEQLAALAQ